MLLSPLCAWQAQHAAWGALRHTFSHVVLPASGSPASLVNASCADMVGAAAHKGFAVAGPRALPDQRAARLHSSAAPGWRQQVAGGVSRSRPAAMPRGSKERERRCSPGRTAVRRGARTSCRRAYFHSQASAGRTSYWAACFRVAACCPALPLARCRRRQQAARRLPARAQPGGLMRAWCALRGGRAPCMQGGWKPPGVQQPGSKRRANNISGGGRRRRQGHRRRQSSSHHWRRRRAACAMCCPCAASQACMVASRLPKTRPGHRALRSPSLSGVLLP